MLNMRTTKKKQFEISAWAVIPKDLKTINSVKDFGIDAFKLKRTALERACPLFKVVKVRIKEISL